jgi:hypothetical protein
VQGAGPAGAKREAQHGGQAEAGGHERLAGDDVFAELRLVIGRASVLRVFALTGAGQMLPVLAALDEAVSVQLGAHPARRRRLLPRVSARRESLLRSHAVTKC